MQVMHVMLVFCATGDDIKVIVLTPEEYFCQPTLT